MKKVYSIRNPKRLPRKLKKFIIKSWNRTTYRGIMKGYIFLVPWVIKYEEPEYIGYVGCEEELSKYLSDEMKKRYSEKPINENYYGKIKLDEL